MATPAPAPVVPPAEALWTATDVRVYFGIATRTLRLWRETDPTFPPPLDLPGRTLRSWVHVAPHVGARMPVAAFDHGLCVRVLNAAHRNLGSAWSQQDVGKWLSAFSSGLVRRKLLDARPLEGVTWTVTAAQHEGEEPRAVEPVTISTISMTLDLAWHLAWRARPSRPGRDGPPRRPHRLDAAGDR